LSNKGLFAPLNKMLSNLKTKYQFGAVSHLFKRGNYQGNLSNTHEGATNSTISTGG